MLKAIRGTRDLLPPDTDLWNRVDARVREVFARYNFQEIRTPIFEDTELFSRSVGEDTDIVSKEMFTWEDKARAQSEKAQSLTLRPENTAGVVRAYIEHGLDKKGVLQKLYYIGPQFRRERPQKGRYRQFFQIGAEIIGPPCAGSELPTRDAEVLEMLAALLDAVGLRDWTLHLNSVGCADDRARYNQALREALQPVVDQMCADCQRRAETNPLRVLDCKVPEDQPIIEKLPKIGEYLDEACREHFAAVRRCWRRWAFPTRSTSAWCGASTITRARPSSSPTATWARRARCWAAAATTDCRRCWAVPRRRASALPSAKTAWCWRCRRRQTPEEKIDAYIAPLGEGMNRHALRAGARAAPPRTAADLGEQGFRLKKSFEAAEKANARFIVIVGENEVAADRFAVKDLASGEQVQLPRQDLPAYLSKGSERPRGAS